MKLLTGFRPIRALVLFFAFAFAQLSFAQNELAVYSDIVASSDQPVTIRLDGQIVETLDAAGFAFFNLERGQHQIEVLTDDGIAHQFNFDSTPFQYIDISVVFANGEPQVYVEGYSSGEEVEQRENAVSGRLSGKVTSGIQPVANAAITFLGTDFLVVTEADGSYTIELPRGLYDVQISHPDFGTRVIPDLRIVASVERGRNFFLSGFDEPQGSVMEEVAVMGKFVPQENATDLERFSENVSDVLDMGQMERFGDGSAAAALTRIVGVTVTDSKYANVRGLDGRYIASTLNGLMMPSTDPMRRDVQLDLFPSNILGGIEIQKSYSADSLGVATGGSVEMRTRGLPDDFVHKISISTSYNTDWTGDEIVSYESSNGDIWGYDSGLRKLPNQIKNATDGGRNLSICDPEIDPVRCTAPIYAAAYAVSLQDDYNVDRKESHPDVGASWSYGDRHDLDFGSFGYYAAASFSHSTDNRINATLSDPVGTRGTYLRAQENTSVSGYLVAGYEYKDADEVLSKTIFLRSTDDTTRISDAVDNEDNGVSRAILEWVEREFVAQQFEGKHEFSVGEETHGLEWRLGYSKTDRYEPDRRTYTYLNNTLATSAVERRWSELAEDSVDFSVDYSIPLTWSVDVSTVFRIGGMVSDRSREVELVRFGVQAGDNADEISFSINENLEEVLSYENFVRDRVRIGANTTDTDSYESDEETTAYYLSALTEFGNDWSLSLGVRQEDFTQDLRYPNEEGASNQLDASETLPALTLSYRFGEDWQFRFGASRTVSYPGLIERSESLSYDPVTDDPIFGNPDLVYSTIDNLDFRVEYYFSPEESITFAYFVKDISDPIERAVPDASGSAADGITFRNSQSADVSGIEVDIYKNVIDAEEWSGFVGANVSIIDSEVQLDEDSIRLEGSDSIGRELQGQSPLLANLQLGLDHYPSDQKFTLLINYFDDRIYRVTRGENNGPEFESGRVMVDFNYEKVFGEAFTLQAQIKNLLNEKVEWTRNGNVIESYENGTSVSLKVSYEF